MERLNEKIILAIRKHVPKNQKIVNYLMELLDLSKESSYRRMRGEKGFTMEEIYQIAQNLNLSIDEIVGVGTNERVFFDLQADTSSDPIHAFLVMLQQNNQIMKQMIKAEYAETITAQNRLSVITHMPYGNIFKFLYYRYLYQIHEVPLNFYYSDLVIPSEIEELREEYNYYSPQIKNITYILDNSIFPKIIKEILYYYRRNLISKDELISMQQDLFTLVDATERMVTNGYNDAGSNRSIYISLFDIDSNFRYLEYDGTIITELWIHPVNPLVIYDAATSALQRKWLGALKKYSTLISQSNELQQSEYLNTQREYIKNMVDKE